MIVNKTDVEEESENRAVDHYNLRMKAYDAVPGKSLKHSITYWKEIEQHVGRILSGETKSNHGKFTDVIFNGIGGSYLGPLMLVVALKGADFNFNSGTACRLHFISNTDPDSFYSLMSKIDLKTTLMVNMSKSGGTSETKGNMDTFNALLKKAEISLIGTHNIAITTPGSNFDKYAKENKFLHIFYMNNETGGRTSVGSAIGMVPCAFAGLKFDQFLEGQSHMDDLCRKHAPLENPAMILAVGIDQMTNQVGRKNMIVLGYSDYLKEFSHYLQQLYMESLGKEYNTKGFPRPEGQTVFGGVGTGEQHAFMQQIQKGINDAFVRFVYFHHRSHDFELEQKGSMGRQLLAFVLGTEEALLKNGKPFISSCFDKCDMFNLGMMISIEENVVSILASFRDINAYDQPGVQDGKLAADKMILVSKTIETELSKLDVWNGDASQAKQQFAPNAPVFFVDSILSDIAGNPKSYKLKQQLVRTWSKNRFIYEYK